MKKLKNNSFVAKVYDLFFSSSIAVMTVTVWSALWVPMVLLLAFFINFKNYNIIVFLTLLLSTILFSCAFASMIGRKIFKKYNRKVFREE